MAIVQKLNIDMSKTNQFQIIVRDETGLQTPSNPNGYGGTNGTGLDMINRYIFDISNLNTNQSWRQIQSDDTSNPDEFYNPSIARIVNKEDVTLDSSNVSLQKFPDGVYKINMNLESKVIFEGDGFVGQDFIVNTVGAQFLYDNFDGIIAGNQIYYIDSVQDTTLILDRNIVVAFNEFKPILKTSKTFILYDNLNDCINKKIANTVSNCLCNNTEDLNNVAELQLLDWGILRSIEKEDFLQAKEYLDLLYRICSRLNCGC